MTERMHPNPTETDHWADDAARRIRGLAPNEIDHLHDEIRAIILEVGRAEFVNRPCSIVITNHNKGIALGRDIELEPSETYTAKIRHDDGRAFEITGTGMVTVVE